MYDQTLDSGMQEKNPILPIQQRWTMLWIGLASTILLELLSLIEISGELSLINRYNTGQIQGDFDLASIEKVGPISILASLAATFSVVAVCVWIYRIGQNIHFAGVKYLNYSPGWYVGWFFIPLVQLVLAFISTVEAYKGSMVINHPKEYSNWKNIKVSFWMYIWYISFLISVVFSLYWMGKADPFEVARNPLSAEAKINAEYFTNINQLFAIPLHAIQGLGLFMFAKKMTQEHLNYKAD